MLTKTKTKLLIREPFFGYLLLKLKFIETESVKTMAVNGVCLWYSPSFVRANTFEHILGVVVHELLHCVLLHISRGALHNKKISNIAADYVVNDYILNKTDFTLPICALYEDRFQNMGYESVYKILYEECEGSPEQSLVEQSQLMGEFEPQSGQTKCEDTNNDSLDNFWESNIQEAANLIKQSGFANSPLVQEILDGLVPPQLPWGQLLARFANKHIKATSSWNRPNRRFIHQGIYLPSRAAKVIDTLVVGWDTSCSVTTVQHNHINAEINKIAARLKPSKIVVIQCDYEIAAVDTYTPKDYPIKTIIAGRRYTEFKPVFEYVDQRNLKPSCLVYFSDLEGDMDFKPPPYPVLWINTAYPNNTKPNFGTVIGLNIQ